MNLSDELRTTLIQIREEAAAELIRLLDPRETYESFPRHSAMLRLLPLAERAAARIDELSRQIAERGNNK